MRPPRDHTFTVAGGIVDLGTLGGFSSAASDINDSAQVTGTSENLNGNNHAYIDP
jgi:uncharacterized membrane protein